jgi:tetratricopeptide (TPR) repeat protein
MLRSWGKQHSKRVDITLVTYQNHPELYIIDEPATYNVGRSLCGENFGGPFTGGPILADWSAARNLVWDRTTADWKLFLDADDVLEDPYSIWGICEVLKANRVDLGLAKYHWAVNADGQPRGASYRERITSASENIRWIYPIHEVLYGSTKHAFIDGNLVAIDKRDSAGKDIRIPGRNFKILYQFAKSHDWDVGSRMMLQLAEAGKPMPLFVREAISVYLERSTWLEERAWAYRLLGETYEQEGDFTRASEHYEQALKEHPGNKAAFALCRSRYHEGRFRECISAYEEGMKHSQILQVIDDGPLYVDISKILVADAWWRLGNIKKALEMVKLARVAFPKLAPLAALAADIEAGKTPPDLHPEVMEEAVEETGKEDDECDEVVAP